MEQTTTVNIQVDQSALAAEIVNTLPDYAKPEAIEIKADSEEE